MVDMSKREPGETRVRTLGHMVHGLLELDEKNLMELLIVDSLGSDDAFFEGN